MARHISRLVSRLLLLCLLAGCASAAAPPPSSGADWSAGPAMPTARSELASAALAGQIYVAGGLRTFGATKAFERFDPASGRWQKLAALPHAFHHFALNALGERIVLTGGYVGFDFRNDNPSTWAYDPAGNVWTRLADMPGPRAAHAAAVLDNKLYVVGGVGDRGRELWVYDPKRDAWDTSWAPLPTRREHLAAVALDGKLYVIGGRWEGEGNLAHIEIFDPEADRWRRGADLPTPRSGLTAAALAGRIHVTGGEAFAPGRTFPEHEVYDPQTDRWASAAPLPTARHGLASAAVAGRWYVIGGGTGAGWRTILTLTELMEVFSPPAADGN